MRGKGGKAMKYSKPEIVVLAPAIKAVQGNDKGNFPYWDGKRCTHAAYEADE
jgi:hypothetical protein